MPSLLFQNDHHHESGDRGPDALFSCAGGGDKASVKRGTCSAFIILKGYIVVVVAVVGHAGQ